MHHQISWSLILYRDRNHSIHLNEVFVSEVIELTSSTAYRIDGEKICSFPMAGFRIYGDRHQSVCNNSLHLTILPIGIYLFDAKVLFI